MESRCPTSAPRQRTDDGSDLMEHAFGCCRQSLAEHVICERFCLCGITESAVFQHWATNWEGWRSVAGPFQLEWSLRIRMCDARCGSWSCGRDPSKFVASVQAQTSRLAKSVRKPELCGLLTDDMLACSDEEVAMFLCLFQASA